MTLEQINDLFERLKAVNPHPTTELEYTSPYTLLVAVVLSAQATDAGVNKATRQLFAVADTPEKMVNLGEEKIRSFIKTINFHVNKAKNILALSRILLEKHQGRVPESREALEDLPGVGTKTANVVLNTVFGHPVIAVDTHVFRVANRTGLAPGPTPEVVAKNLEKIIPDPWKPNAHHWLILHGRYVCKARNPLCNVCPIVDLCGWEEKGEQLAKLETKRSKTKASSFSKP